MRLGLLYLLPIACLYAYSAYYAYNFWFTLGQAHPERQWSWLWRAASEVMPLCFWLLLLGNIQYSWRQIFLPLAPLETHWASRFRFMMIHAGVLMGFLLLFELCRDISSQVAQLQSKTGMPNSPFVLGRVADSIAGSLQLILFCAWTAALALVTRKGLALAWGWLIAIVVGAAIAYPLNNWDGNSNAVLVIPRVWTWLALLISLSLTLTMLICFKKKQRWSPLLIYSVICIGFVAHGVSAMPRLAADFIKPWPVELAVLIDQTVMSAFETPWPASGDLLSVWIGQHRVMLLAPLLDLLLLFAIYHFLRWLDWEASTPRPPQA